MSANNQCCLIGRVGKDPETRTSQSGVTTTSFSLAVTRHGQKDKDGKEQTDWFSVTLFRKQAEVAADLLHKGDLVAVTGAVHVDEWTDREGNRQKMVKLLADGFQLCQSKEPRDGQSEPRQRSSKADERDERSKRAAAGDDFFDEDDIPDF